ncbi:MAG: glycosyltransferase family 2 protein [Bacteroidetes bacterium]|nr:glycosyltransferase family 2 protein [Bacteroidota bacterium]MBU1422046.1 glycosyltransferase family 2 protein [Bacteroidota bacterium]
MTGPLVYIIVLSWNGKADTLECLSSLKELVYPNYRVLVVDNASSDGSAEEVKSQFPDVELIVNKENLRFAGGNNVGIEYAVSKNADYILLINNDTIVDNNFLSELVRTAESDNEIGMVGPKIYYYSEPNRIWYAGGKIELWKGWLSHIGVRELDNGQYNQTKETDFISGCCLLVKSEVIKKVGLLDTAYYIYGEDVDWCVRASRAGYRLMYEPKAIIWHKLSVSTGGHLSWFKNWNKLKSQLRIMARYAKWYNWLTIPFFMLVNVVLSYARTKKIK